MARKRTPRIQKRRDVDLLILSQPAGKPTSRLEQRVLNHITVPFLAAFPDAEFEPQGYLPLAGESHKNPPNPDSFS